MTSLSSASAAEPAALPGGRLLVVDGALVQRLIVQRTAAALGFQADAAGDPAGASRLLCARPYDVLLLDLWIDGEGGRELLRVAADAGARPQVILAGAAGPQRDAAAALATALGLPVAASLAKPFEVPRLREALCQARGDSGAPDQSAALVAADADAFAGALAAGEVGFAFQPQVALRPGRPAGAEALARWTSPRFGTVPPERFLPLAIQSGTVALLADVALRAALAACAQWRCLAPWMTVAVNLPAATLRDAGLPALIGQRLREAGLPPAALVIDVTATEAEGCAAELTALHGTGLGIAVAGFEAGEMPLRALQRLPADLITLGPGLLRTALRDPAGAALLRALIAGAHALDRRVAALAVETAATEAMLLAAGCDQAQGWLYGPAMSAEAILRWLGPGEA